MLLLVLALNMIPAQVLGGDAFEDLAKRTDARCASRHIREITPADLDLAQETFIGSLAAPERQRLASVDEAERRCAGRDGLSCPTTARLEAMRKTRLIKRFAAYVCVSKDPAS
jgi:hypothetical protein